MEETPSVIDLARDFVMKKEKEWVMKRWAIVKKLEKQAKISQDPDAQTKYKQANDVLSRELDRLCYADPDPYES
jgi:hypothetical protein